RSFTIGEGIAIIGMRGRRVAADIAFDGLQAVGAHHGGRIDSTSKINGVITSQGSCRLTSWRRASSLISTVGGHKLNASGVVRGDPLIQEIDAAREAPTAGARSVGNLLDDGITDRGTRDVLQVGDGSVAGGGAWSLISWRHTIQIPAIVGACAGTAGTVLQRIRRTA